MSKVRNTSKLTADGGVTPGSYILAKLNLTASNETVVDIKELVTRIVISESIYAASIDIELYMLDGVNLFEEMKLNGDEKLELLIKRKDLDTKDTKNHSHVFYISEILDFARNKNGSASYVIRGVSKHAYINNTKTLNLAKEGTIGTIIQQICKSDLKITKMDINTSTHKNIKVIIPKLRPLAAIKWLNYNSFTSAGAPFYFFETLKGKVQYKSLEEFKDTEKDLNERVYNHTPVQTYDIGSPEFFKEASRRVTKLSSELNLSKFTATNEGAYASTTKSIDIATKKYNTTSFKYGDESLQLNTNKPYPDQRANYDHYDGKELNQINTSKNYFISTNSLSHKNNDFQSPAIDNRGKGQSYLSTEDTLVHDIVIPGNFDLECGQVMKLNVNKTGAEDNISQPLDKMQSGKYLITSISHIFGDQYSMNVEIKTNSFNADLNDILTVKEDKESTEAKT
jgi:hypothetical protein